MIVSSKSAKTVTILGSTGSIGKNTVKILQQSDKNFSIRAITANTDYKLLAEQAISLKAKRAVIADDSLYQSLKDELSGTSIEVAAGKDEVVNAASLESDVLVSAIVGDAGLEPTIAAIKRGAIIALANKECLVCAGELMMEVAKANGAKIIPVDSEHNAIFQVFSFDKIDEIERIILTASGGPFRGFSKAQLEPVTIAQAIKHPNWSMGKKISVDSATMMNKGLEVIEAFYLFPVDKDKIDVIIHPESIIHSMVEYIDGSILAELGMPDMCTPISYALGWPDRIKIKKSRMNFTDLSKLSFEDVNNDNFPAVDIAKQALEIGGAAPIVFNSANEVAVENFLNSKIGFTDITKIVRDSLSSISYQKPDSIDDVVEIIRQTKPQVKELIKKYSVSNFY